MSILVNKTDTFTIKVIVGIEECSPKKFYCCLASTPQTSTWPAGIKQEEHSFTFYPLDLGTNAKIIDRSVSLTDRGVRLDGAALRFNRIASTLASWTIVDDNGKPVEVNETTVATLPPVVATVLGDELDKSQTGI